MLQRILFAGAAIIAVICAVIVGGLYPLPAEAGGWTGCYGGVTGGYSTATTDASVAFGGTVIDVDSLGYSGGSYGGVAGCDLQAAAKVVVGIRGSYEKTNADFDVTVTGAPGSIVHTGLDTSWAVVGRAGYLAAPNAMLYGLVGYTEASPKDISFPAFGPGVKPIGVPNLTGYVLGVGAEFALGNGLFLGTEYTFANYGKADIALGTGLNPPVLGLDTDVQEAKVLLTYKFGTDTPIVRDVANAVAPVGHTPLK